MNMQRKSSGFTHIAAMVAINAAALFSSSTATAAKAPLSVEDLAKNADVIVVGSIEDIRIESEPSRLAPGFGNSDWVILLTLAVENVENGNLSERRIEARCTRVRTRRSLQEFVGLAGHRPIPRKGARVRVYLAADQGAWAVVMPNGITQVDYNGQNLSLGNATEVANLGSPRYSYVLPLEIWTFVAVLGISVSVVICLLRRQKLRQQVCETELSGAEKDAGVLADGLS